MPSLDACHAELQFDGTFEAIGKHCSKSKNNT
jgi:hypothetical protein